MRPAKGLKVTDVSTGTGAAARTGDMVIVEFECRLGRGEVLFSSEEQGPSQILVGARNTAIGIEHGVIGMKQGGVREVRVPPHLAHIERQSLPELPESSVLRYTLRVHRVHRASDE